MDPSCAYSFYWNEIKRLAPCAVLLRGPADLNPVQSAGRDLDILLPTDHAAVKAFLREQGFWRAYRPETYVESYQLRLIDDPNCYNVDLYKAHRWGLGFRLSAKRDALVDQELGCLLHAVVDGKGTLNLEKWQKGSIGPRDAGSNVDFSGVVSRALWRSGNTCLLSAYLLLTGVIRPDPWMILRNMLRRIASRIWQLKCKRGLEVALVGVDGSGKSTLAQALLCLPAPVRVVYMGDKEYTTWLRRLVGRLKLPWPIPQLALSYDLFRRRLSGWFYAVRGWVVIYDRHPLELLYVRPTSLTSVIRNCISRMAAWPPDLTFLLTGDYVAMHGRKRERSAVLLKVIDEHILDVLQKYSIPFEKIDTTKESLDSTRSTIASRILARYREHASLDHLQGVLRTILA